MGNTFHVALDVRGSLKHASRGELAGMFVSAKTGKRLTADEAEDVLLEHLASGHEVIPLADECQGFDYSGGGCPGHSCTPAEAQPPRDLGPHLNLGRQ